MKKIIFLFIGMVLMVLFGLISVPLLKTVC